MSKLAVEMFCYKVAKCAASYIAALGGIPDAIAFTAGIGEKSSIKRARILEMLAPLGFTLNQERNASNGVGSDGFITTENSEKAALVIKTNEELVIALATQDLLLRQNQSKTE